MVRNLLVTSALLAIALAVALPGWIALHPDAAAPEDADLRLDLTEIPELATGYPLFEAAAEAARMPVDPEAFERMRRFREGESGESEWISDLFERNAEALDLLDASLAAPLLQFPSDSAMDAIQNRMEVHVPVQQLIRLAGAQSRLALERGDPERALEFATLGVRVGRAVSSGENITLLDMLMAASYTDIALADIERIARTGPLTPETAHRLVDLLESTRWTSADWERVWAFEYQFVKAMFLEVGERGGDAMAAKEAGLPSWVTRVVPVGYVWQPNQTLSLLSDAYREQISKSGVSCADSPLELEPLAEPEAASLSALLLPNAAGRQLVEIVHPSFDRFQLQRCQYETRVSLVQVLVAARSHWDREGRLPETLEALVPRDLAAVPLDRYDGSPLRYSSARQWVWSVGEDFEDAGGDEAAEPTRRAEPTISLAF